MEAGEAVRDGILSAMPDAEVSVKETADGGEGTLAALRGIPGRTEKLTVHDPLGRKIEAEYIVTDQGTAIIESASAIGLTLLKKEERDPEIMSTYGLGEIIRHAVMQGVRHFVIGIGGSATNDGGAGMLGALGYRFYDRRGDEILPENQYLKYLDRIDVGHALPQLPECTFRIACDVTNPLFGEEGASFIYGPQKGADEASVQRMDQTLRHFAKVTKKYLPSSDPTVPGSGAAGGLGFAFRSYLNGELVPGAALIIEESGLAEDIRKSDLVVTGEGRLDAQTLRGKAPAACAALARECGKPVISVSGSVDPGTYNVFSAYFSTVTTKMDESVVLDSTFARKRLRETSERVFTMVRIGQENK